MARVNERKPPNQNTNPDDLTGGADPHDVLLKLRKKLEYIASEYAAGKLNPSQFNALYRHYTEKRVIIEKLLARNPESDAWRSVAEHGQTGFLRHYFEARTLYLMVFRHNEQEPLFVSGKLPTKAVPQIQALLQTLWRMQSKRQGLARKALGDGQWVVLAVGEEAMTLVVFSLQPSTTQMNRLRDLHADFERANKLALQRGFTAKRMVFPQRAFIEGDA